MAKPLLEFRLLVDNPADAKGQEGDGAEEKPSAFHALSLPNAPSCLSGGENGMPKVSAAEEAVREAAYVFEPIWSGAGPQLLLLATRGSRVVVNGRPAPRVALLKEKDEVAFEDSASVLRVTLYQRTSLGPPPPAYVGKECPFCRVHFKADDRSYVCHNCGTPMHLQGEEVPKDDRLECAAMATECRVCKMQITLAEGYTYVPTEGVA